MNDFHTKELARTETQLYRVQQELTTWERSGSADLTMIAQSFVRSLQEYIAELKSDLAVGHC
jgi:hypothetical protein